MLSFEITEDKTIEVFFDEEGRDLLLRALSHIQAPGDHEHLMTEAWGGLGLSEQTHSPLNHLAHMVTIGMLRKLT